MNKKLDIRKNANILFIINIIIFVTLIFFKYYYTKLYYAGILVNICLGLNIILFIIGVIFNILFIKKANYYDKTKVTIIIVAIFIVYLLFNTIGIMTINRDFVRKYTKNNLKLSSYCYDFGCDRYETISKNNYEEFIMEKKYMDYNNVENDIKIINKYNTKDIMSVKAIVYSQNEMFSETLIAEQVKDYFENFNYEIKENLIREAFDKRFESSVKNGKATYKVTEIYNKDNELDKLKTEITIKLR